MTFLVAAALLPTTAARADDPLVPDVALEAAIRDELGIYGRDLTDEDLKELTYLEAVGAGIAGLEGMQHCTNVETLILPCNQLVDLLPLAGLNRLRYLDLSDNQLTDISHLSGAGMLMAFNVSGNQVSDLSVVQGMGPLRWFDACSNQVADISALEERSNLMWVGLGGNLIADISPLYGKSSLWYLDLSDNQITGEPELGDMGCLEHLDLGSNDLAAAPIISNWSNLTWLSLADNHIADISNMQNWNRLRHLDLSGNEVGDLAALSNLNDLEHLDLAGNNITDANPLNNKSQLTWLDLGDNCLSQLPSLNGLNYLTYLGLGDNRFIKLSINWPPRLQGLDLSGNLLENPGDLSSLDDLVWLDLSDNRITNLSNVNGMEQLEELDLSGNQIETINNFWGMDRLLWLNLGDNCLTNCSGLSSLTQLKELSLRGNQITSLSNLPELHYLWRLDVSWNQLTNISQLECMKNMEELYLCGNYDLEWINSVEYLHNLRVLDAGHCRISQIGQLSELPALQDVNLQWNNVQNIQPLAENLALAAGDRLDLRGNPLQYMAIETHIPYLRFRGVEVLYDGEPAPMAVSLRRSLRCGLAGTPLDDLRTLSLHVEGEGLRDVRVSLPWGDELLLSDELGSDWPRRDCLTLYRGPLSIFTWSDGQGLYVDLAWEGLTDEQLDAVRVNDLNLEIERGAASYPLQLNFNETPQPEQEPCVLAPLHRDAVASRGLTVEWNAWTDPPENARVEACVNEVPFGWQYDGSQYSAAFSAPAGPTAWTPPTVPASDGYYDCGTAFATFQTDDTNENYTVEVSSASESRGAFEVTGAYDGHGNTPVEATLVAVPSSTVGGIEYWGDQDMFALEATAGTTYDIRVTSDDALAKCDPPLEDSCLWLYDTDGLTRLAWDDDGGLDGGSRLVWTAPADGAYYVAVDAYDVDDIGRYTLEVDTIVPPADGPAIVYDHAGRWLTGDGKAFLLAVSSPYTDSTCDARMATLARMNIPGILDGTALDTPEAGRAYCRNLEQGVFVPGGRFVYIDESNTHKDDSQERWSELVVMNVSSATPVEACRLRLRLPRAGAVTVYGQRVYVATQFDDDSSRVYIEVYDFDSYWTNWTYQGTSEALVAPAGYDAEIERMAFYGNRLYCLHDDFAAVTVFDASNPVPQNPRQIPLDEPGGDDLAVTSGPVLWVGQGWSLHGYNVNDLSNPILVATCDLGGRPGRILQRADELLFVGVVGLGVKVVDLSAKPSELPVLHTFAAETATGSLAVARNHLFVPTGQWKTAVFPLFEAWIETENDRDWVYQNTQSMIDNTGGHHIRMEVVCRDFLNTSVSIASVVKVDDGGTGQIMVENDPEGDPMVKYLVGGLRTDGTTGTGPLTLRVTVNGNVSGATELLLPLSVRVLGDIDANGGVEPSDLSLLILELNGMHPPGYDAWTFDIDSNGGAEPGDLSLLINILNGMPIH
ncbi:MAG: leucine-rich repeat domain-containing protein [Planctomycetes bacterium]|nr:leucine-rich repeat domain-containing protein [Planctomycetota bacterium]